MNLRDRLFPPRPDLPAEVTSIDVMKTVALVLMVIDHVGWLLFPQIEWFRVLGRLCIPLWFFLIGYARARDVPTRWLVAGIIMMVSNILVGLPALPLAVLFTMALTRVAIDPFWRFVAAKPYYFWWSVLLLMFAAYATGLVVEYGTIGFLLACCGYAVRNREEVDTALEGVARTPSQALMIAVFIGFGILEAMSFGFSMLAFAVLLAGLTGVYFVLQTFETKTLPGVGNANLFQFFGRYTLEIYVIHLLVLKAVFGLQVLAIYLIG
jgi:hypothetical protein